MTLFEISNKDRLNYNGQVYTHHKDVHGEEGKIFSRTYKRYHDGKHQTFFSDHKLDLFDMDLGGILYYRFTDL
jgi:hypothetical protein